MNTVEKVFCPSCGAPVVFEENSEEVFCSHCGSRLHRDDDNIVRKMEHTEKMAEYQDRHEEREFDSQKRLRDIRDSIIYSVLLIVFSAMVIGLLHIAM